MEKYKFFYQSHQNAPRNVLTMQKNAREQDMISTKARLAKCYKLDNIWHVIIIARWRNLNCYTTSITTASLV